MNLNPVIIIPARLGSTRLPGKPLALINGQPMIAHVVARAIEADIAPVFVATDHEQVMATVRDCGVKAVMTQPDHPSGSDRIHEALQKIDPEVEFDAIINVQGDLPAIDPQLIRAALAPLQDSHVDIATLCAEITRDEEKNNPNVVKLIGTPVGEKRLRALYFTRSRAPYGEGVLYHHIGLYSYRRQALARFVSLPPSLLEMREKLEQLRALEAGMRIDGEIVDTAPLGVDTGEDLHHARHILSGM